MPGQLFTEYFLSEGIQATPEWREAVEDPADLLEIKKSLSERMDLFAGFSDPNESLTELDLVRPAFDLLGWTDYLPQQGVARNEDIPDHPLFADSSDKERAGARSAPQDRYADALLVQESKRFGLPLDNRDQTDKVQSGTPHGQILRYLSTAESVSDGRIRWGILTNGTIWRLYEHRARPRATGYYEADLREVLEQGDDPSLRTFLLLFRRESFIRQDGATATFLEEALYSERAMYSSAGAPTRISSTKKLPTWIGMPRASLAKTTVVPSSTSCQPGAFSVQVSWKQTRAEVVTDSAL